ncbi:FAS1 domain-containing protein [Myriangium duriaei CBS 260.36]|uniref:FAS1 domain-containing protein n=1 Tax=Myriangium duriaei CBS 260.36 TaxID=1168546 RepID=A0A9P4MN33_9PEZI|nr:FAS1 domain-containing protein [Myriangium duriaei CBS 260.36]
MKPALLILATSTLATSLTLPHLLRPTKQITMTSSQHIADILPLTKRINIFASLTRDIEPISDRLSSPDRNTTVLAPTNSALTALPRKPWENPADYDSMGTEAYAGDDGQKRAYENLAKFVSAHVVPASPWEQGKKVRTLAGGEVWWEEDRQGTKRVMPGGVEVLEIGKQVGNGEVWVLKDALNYA